MGFNLSFVHVKIGVIGIRKIKTVGGFNPGPFTLHPVVLPLSYSGEIHASGQFP